MRSALAMGLALLLVLVAVPAWAGDGNVPQATLASLGLGDMQTVSDAAGMQVRGMSSNARAASFGLVSAFLFDPNTGAQFVFGQNAFSSATDENAGLNATSSATAGPVAATIPAFTHTITFNGVTWTATIGAFGFTGGALATSP